MKRSVVVVLLVIAVVLGLFFYMSTANASEECNVCVTYQGRDNCATAAGPTTQAATQAAQTTACGPLAGGMTDTQACLATPPRTVECRHRS